MISGEIQNIQVIGSGLQSIQGTYTPNTNYYLGSHGTVQVQGLIPTTTAVSPSVNPSYQNQPVIFTAMVTATGGGMPTGTVTFTSDGGPISECPNPVNLVGRQATCTTSTLPLGMHTIAAMYSGDRNFAPSNGQLSQQVLAQNGTSTTLAISPTMASSGQVVTLTAAVVINGEPVTVGTVTFLSGTQVLGTAQVVGSDMSGFTPGTATLKLGFPPGTYSLTAQYNAIYQFGGSQSGPQPLTVTGMETTTTTVTATPDGNNYDFSAVVFGYGLAVPNPTTGTVSLTEVSSGMNLGNITLAGPAFAFSPASPNTATVGNQPNAVAVGDFDGNGVADLAVVNQGDGTISILLGNGDGTFQPQPAISVCGGASSIAVGDFNGDGIPDLVVGCGGAVDVLFGQAGGMFGSPTSYGGFGAIDGVAVGDFNGDGNADIAASDAEGSVHVLLNDGTGNFSQQQFTASAGVSPNGITVGDYNRDGKLDVAVPDGSGNTVNVLLGDGTGSLGSLMMYTAGSQPFSIVTADFNGDGCPDLAVANSGDLTVGVFLGIKDSGACLGTFAAQSGYEVGGGPAGIAVADFNGDGCPDLVVTNSAPGDSTVGVLLGKLSKGVCQGTFQSQQTNSAGFTPYGIAIGDFNGDGVPDLAATNFSRTTTTVILNGTASSGSMTNVFVPGLGQQQVNAGYTPNTNFYLGSQGSVVVNGSGLIPTNTAVSPSLNPSYQNQPVTFTAMVTATGGGMPTGTVTFTSDGGPISECPNPVNLVGGQATCTTSTLPVGTHTIVAMYSGDSNFAPSSGQTSQQVLPQNETGTALTISPTTASAGQVVTLTATVSSSIGPATSGTVTFLSGTQVLGTVQVVGIDMSGFTPGTATLKLGFPPGTYSLRAQYNANYQFGGSQSGPQPLTVTGTEPTTTTLTAAPDGNHFDFTASVFGNGFPAPTGQVQFNDLTSGLPLGSIMLTGQGMLSFQPPQTSGTGTLPADLTFGDFRGIGIADLAVTNSPDNTVSVLKGNGDGTFQPQVTYPVGTNPAGIVAADFTGNGILDLAVANQADGTLGILLGNGDGTFKKQQSYNLLPGDDPASIVTGDFNGDGVVDLAIVNPEASTVDILLGNGNGTFQTPEQLIFFYPSGAAVGDFNGDGILDLCVLNADNTVSILLGNGDGTFQAGTTYPVGALPTNIAVADFNNDHILDLAVANDGDGTVSILLGNGDGTFRPQQIVNVGGSPVGITTADFNGDGNPDLAVTNDSDSIAVLLGKGNGSFQAAQYYPAGSLTLAVVAADLNGDDVPDLVAVNQNSSTVSILLGGTNTTAQLSNIPIMGSGNHMIQASYAPDGASIYASSLSNTVTVPAGGKQTPTVNLTVTPSPVNFGSNTYFTAMLQTTGGLTPTGTVTFAEGTTVLATANVDMNGQASYTNNTLVLGQHTITATYNGDNNFNPASGTVKLQVNTPFTLTGDMNSGTVTPPQPATFTVTVDAAWQNPPLPLIYAVMTCSAPAGLTCSVACPTSPSNPPGLGPPLCVVTGLNKPSSTMATVTVDTSGLARLNRPLRQREQRVMAAWVGFGGFGLVGLVFVPVKLRRKATATFLFLMMVVLCFGIGCTAFAPGSSSSPVNNTFNIKVTATLLEENSQSLTGYNKLGLQVFWYELLIK